MRIREEEEKKKKKRRRESENGQKRKRNEPTDLEEARGLTTESVEEVVELVGVVTLTLGASETDREGARVWLLV
jgi:hypothetical protein